jgi:hypothetical protein
LYDLAVEKKTAKKLHEHAKNLVEEKNSVTGVPDGGGGEKKDTSPKNTKKPGKPGNSQKITVSPARKPVNPQKPLVKIPSMDSKDSGYSSQSQRSSNTGKPPVKTKALVHQNSREVLRNPEDAESVSEGGSIADVRKGEGRVTFKDSQSALLYKTKNPLNKQDSMGTVSIDCLSHRFNLAFVFLFSKAIFHS